MAAAASRDATGSGLDDDARGEFMTSVAASDARRDEASPPDLRSWHETSWIGPLMIFVLTFGSWLASLAVGLWSESWAVRVLVALPLTLASAQLFTLAHDAGHGSFSTSPQLNAVVGRLALLPSIHVFGLWRLHHDVHHRYTNLRGLDFVWTPLSVADYRALSPPRRTFHRIYRHRSGLGLGLHYAVQVWAPRMLWPRTRHELADRRRLVVDAIGLYAALVALAIAAVGFVAAVDPDRVDDSGSWISAVFFLVVLPLIGTQWLIGFVIYLNHTHPDVVWYDDRDEWRRHEVQVEGATGPRFSPLRHAFVPRRIMNHTAHHVDPAVPLRLLPDAQRRLVDECGDRIVSYEWSPKVFRDVLSRCKLYDYDAQRWLTYAAAEERR